MALTLPKLSTDQVNYLNIGLMVISSVFAFLWPFETFLIVYAVLGPLHYLTEISWLHDKKYYTKRKHDAYFLYVIGVLIWMGFSSSHIKTDNDLYLSAIIYILVMCGLAIMMFKSWLARGIAILITLASSYYFKDIAAFSSQYSTMIIYIAFMSALVFVLFEGWTARGICFFIILVSSNFLSDYAAFSSIFSIYLPTIIHVFLFTALFILIGALRGRSVSGIASLVVFALCTIAFFVWHVHTGYVATQKVKDYYLDFSELNYALMMPFSKHDLGVPDNITSYVAYVKNILYASPAAIAIMRFIAFAYMYHYLNWFSKTSVIQWHNIPRWRFMGVIVLWLAALGAYAYDYKTGLQWLFFLSFTHVLLEFPLNHVTFINIGRQIKSMVSPAQTT